MEAPKRTRSCCRDRQESGAAVSKPLDSKVSSKSDVIYGDRQICLPISVEDYALLWDDPVLLRQYIEDLIARHPDLFPPGIKDGFHLTGKLPESKKLLGIRLRQLRLKVGGVVYTLRPSFVLPYMMGKLVPHVSQEAKEVTPPNIEIGLELLSHHVPVWLVTKACGGNDMFWERLMRRLGMNSLVGTTVHDPEQLPEHLAADEHHVDWCHEKGYIALTAGEDCILGLALTPMADEEHLQEAYAVFQQEAQAVKADYLPKTVNTDGWSATQNAFRTLFSTIAVILCFLHGFLKIRDRCRKSKDIHDEVWNVYYADTAEQFKLRMENLRTICETSSWPATAKEMVNKLCNRADEYAESYSHPDCYRTSNQVDRPMNALHRQIYAGRGLHGHLLGSERRLRGWALLYNFRPYAFRSGQARNENCRAHRLNNQQYSQNWVENLLISASGGGRIQCT